MTTELDRAHRVFIETLLVLKCASCQVTFDDLEAAKRHVLHGGQKIGTETTPYPCDEPGCDRAFSSEHGLAVHQSRSHKAVGRE